MLEKAQDARAEIRHAEKTYLEGLGAKWEDFEGKKVLDIGALDVSFARAAAVHGIKVVALDRKSEPKLWESYGLTPTDGDEFVEADAAHMPFEDESFDIAVSHAGPFTSAEERAVLEARFREVHRILKPGGELRLGRTFIFSPEDEKMLEKLPEMSNVEKQNIMQARARGVIDDIRKKIPFDLVEFRVHKRRPDGFAYCHYVLRKPLK